MTDVKIYKCEKCNYSTKRKNDYTKHLKSKSHNDLKIYKIYKCELCNFKTTKKIDFNVHILYNHSTLEEKKQKFKYFCESCNFGTITEKVFETHKLTQKHKRRTIKI